MEVETNSIPSFDINSTARPFCTQSAGSELMETKVLNSKCDDNESCSESAAMRVQKYYRGYRTRRLLADTAVAAEEFW